MYIIHNCINVSKDMKYRKRPTCQAKSCHPHLDRLPIQNSYSHIGTSVTDSKYPAFSFCLTKSTASTITVKLQNRLKMSFPPLQPPNRSPLPSFYALSKPIYQRPRIFFVVCTKLTNLYEIRELNPSCAKHIRLDMYIYI